MSVSNVGRKPAKKIEIVFNWTPPFMNVWPKRHYTTVNSPDGRHSIVLDDLAPGEVFGMEIMAINVALPQLCNVRSEEALSQQKAMIPQIVQTRSVIAFVTWLLFSGTIFSIYLALVLIEYVAR